MSIENELIEAALKEADIAYTVVSTGVSRAWGGDHEMDGWRLTFERQHRKDPSKPYDRFEMEYFTGMGHRVWKGMKPSNMPRPGTLAREQLDREHMKPVKPTVAGPLHSVVMDGSAANESFNDWCSNFGYDPDSMKAFRTYQDCCDIGQRARAFFGSTLMAKIEELLQDY